MSETHIVKRKGHKEKFDERKAYASVYWACRSSHLHAQECEQIAQKVVSALQKHIHEKKEVDSAQIFEFIGKELQKHNEHVAYMYKTHRDIS